MFGDKSAGASPGGKTRTTTMTQAQEIAAIRSPKGTNNIRGRIERYGFNCTHGAYVKYLGRLGKITNTSWLDKTGKIKLRWQDGYESSWISAEVDNGKSKFEDASPEEEKECKQAHINYDMKQSDVVLTLKICAFERVDAVYYNGAKLHGIDNTLRRTFQTVSFPHVEGAVLCISVKPKKSTGIARSFGNSRMAALLCSCEARDRHTGEVKEHFPWNFTLTPWNAAFYVRAVGCRETDDSVDPEGWYQNRLPTFDAPEKSNKTENSYFLSETEKKERAKEEAQKLLDPKKWDVPVALDKSLILEKETFQLHVGNLEPFTEEDHVPDYEQQLKTFFRNYGGVASAKVTIRDRTESDGTRKLSYAVVTFENRSALDKALKNAKEAAAAQGLPDMIVKRQVGTRHAAKEQLSEKEATEYMRKKREKEEREREKIREKCRVHERVIEIPGAVAVWLNKAKQGEDNYNCNYFRFDIETIHMQARLSALTEDGRTGADDIPSNGLFFKPGWTTPVHAAICYGDKASVIKDSMDKAHMVEKPDENGLNALHRAAQANAKSDVIEMLLEDGHIAINRKDYDKWFPLHHAANVGAPLGTILMLLKHSVAFAPLMNSDGFKTKLLEINNIGSLVDMAAGKRKSFHLTAADFDEMSDAQKYRLASKAEDAIKDIFAQDKDTTKPKSGWMRRKVGITNNSKAWVVHWVTLDEAGVFSVWRDEDRSTKPDHRFPVSECEVLELAPGRKGYEFAFEITHVIKRHGKEHSMNLVLEPLKDPHASADDRAATRMQKEKGKWIDAIKEAQRVSAATSDAIEVEQATVEIGFSPTLKNASWALVSLVHKEKETEEGEMKDMHDEHFKSAQEERETPSGDKVTITEFDHTKKTKRELEEIFFRRADTKVLTTDMFEKDQKANVPWTNLQFPWLQGLNLLVSEWKQHGCELNKDTSMLQHVGGSGTKKKLWTSPFQEGDDALNWLRGPPNEDGNAGDTMLHKAVWSLAHPSVILLLLDSWPAAVKVEGDLGTPLQLAAEIRLDFEATIRMVIVSAGLGELTSKEITPLTQCGVLKRFAEALHDTDTDGSGCSGARILKAALERTPNVIAACLNVAKALRKARKADPGRRVLFAQALEKMIDVATEFAFKVNLALEQVPERDKKQAAEALLQPDPEETIANAVMLHDKESLSTPWIIGYVSLRVPTSASCLALFCFAVR